MLEAETLKNVKIGKAVGNNSNAQQEKEDDAEKDKIKKNYHQHEMSKRVEKSSRKSKPKKTKRKQWKQRRKQQMRKRRRERLRQQETSVGGRKKLQPNSATWTFLLDLSSEQLDKLIKRDGLLSRYTACKNEEDLKRWLEHWIQEFRGDEYVARTCGDNHNMLGGSGHLPPSLLSRSWVHS